MPRANTVTKYVQGKLVGSCRKDSGRDRALPTHKHRAAVTLLLQSTVIEIHKSILIWAVYVAPFRPRGITSHRIMMVHAKA